jgi:hypothetical protein
VCNIPRDVSFADDTFPCQLFSGSPVTLDVKCDSKDGKCPSANECAKMPLSRDVQEALAKVRPRLVSHSNRGKPTEVNNESSEGGKR